MSKANFPVGDALLEIMTGFLQGQKKKNRVRMSRFYLLACGSCRSHAPSGQLLVDEGCQLRFAHGADFGGCQLTVLENHQGGNATDAELGWDVAVLVHVHLGHLQFAFVGTSHFVQDRGDHFAGAAPFGPEVDNHRLARLEDVGVKTGVGDVFDQIAGHGLFLVNIEDAAKVEAILTESRHTHLSRACCHPLF